MRIKQFSLVVIFLLTIIPLQACNLKLSVVNPEGSPTTMVAIPSNTPLPSPSPTLPPTATLTFTPAPTLPPSATPTLFFESTATPTMQWSACPGIVVTRTDTNSGDMLHILRCEDSLEYDMGPFARGVYAVGPNDKFIIYLTANGKIYGARIGNSSVVTIFDLVTERQFTALNRKMNGDFKISFTGSEINYQLVIFEQKFGQKRVYDLPVTITR